MKKQTIVAMAVIMIGGMNAARAFNPGVYYYSNEETEAKRMAAYSKAHAKQAKRFAKASKRHYKQTTKALNQAMKQHHAYRHMLAMQDQYADSIQRFQPYRAYDYNTQSVHATMVDYQH